MSDEEQQQSKLPRWWIVYARNGTKYHYAQSPDGQTWQTKCGHPGNYRVLPPTPRAPAYYPCTLCFPETMDES